MNITAFNFQNEIQSSNSNQTYEYRLCVYYYYKPITVVTTTTANSTVVPINTFSLVFNDSNKTIGSTTLITSSLISIYETTTTTISLVVTTPNTTIAERTSTLSTVSTETTPSTTIAETTSTTSSVSTETTPIATIAETTSTKSSVSTETTTSTTIAETTSTTSSESTETTPIATIAETTLTTSTVSTETPTSTTISIINTTTSDINLIATTYSTTMSIIATTTSESISISTTILSATICNFSVQNSTLDNLVSKFKSNFTTNYYSIALSNELTGYSVKNLLCENITTPFVSNLNSTINELHILLLDLINVNITEIDILSYWWNEAFSSLKNVSISLPNIMIRLNETINKQKYTTDDLSTAINELQIIVNNSLMNLKSNNFVSTNPTNYINTEIFPETFNTFQKLKQVSTNLVNILNSMLLLLSNMNTYNNDLIYYRYLYCVLSFDQVYSNILNVQDEFKAMNQLTLITNFQISFILSQFLDYRYQDFLGNTLNESISLPLNVTSSVVYSLHCILLELNKPLELIYEINNVTNSSSLNSTLFETKLQLDDSIQKIANYNNQINILNYKNFTDILFYIDQTTSLFKIYSDYVVVLLNKTDKIVIP